MTSPNHEAEPATDAEIAYCARQIGDGSTWDDDIVAALIARIHAEQAEKAKAIGALRIALESGRELNFTLYNSVRATAIQECAAIAKAASERYSSSASTAAASISCLISALLQSPTDGGAE